MNRLAIAERLFSTLDNEHIRYSHWKSNEHLGAALQGLTDLDLLVMPADKDRFGGVVRGLRFVPMVAAEIREIPSVESYLGFDPETGTLLHLDVQYRLIVGEQLIKNHHLPVEDWLLSGSVRVEGVQTPAPSHEFLLLYVRAMLKTTVRQILRSIVKGGSPVPERVMVEARWLVDQVDEADLAEAVASSGLEVTAAEVSTFRQRILADSIDWRYVLNHRQSLRKRLRQHERLRRYQAVSKRLGLWFRSTSIARRLGWGIPKRTLDGTAPLVAAVGADGSGKSRLTKDLERWLGSKLEVRHVYFGQPKGGLLWRLLNKPGSLVRKGGDGRGSMSKVASRTDTWKWLWLARHRRRLAQDARDDTRDGVTVIAERFPLAEFQNMSEPMDGPRLQGSSGGTARRELAIYRSIDPPDLTIVLKTDLEILRERKLDLTLEEHTAKVEAVAGLETAPDRVVIDAGPPYERVLLEAKTALWEAILETR